MSGELREVIEWEPGEYAVERVEDEVYSYVISPPVEITLVFDLDGARVRSHPWAFQLRKI